MFYKAGKFQGAPIHCCVLKLKKTLVDCCRAVHMKADPISTVLPEQVHRLSTAALHSLEFGTPVRIVSVAIFLGSLVN